MSYLPDEQIMPIEREMSGMLTDAERAHLILKFRPTSARGVSEVDVPLEKVPKDRLPVLPENIIYDGIEFEIRRKSPREWLVSIEPRVGSSPVSISLMAAIGQTGKLNDVTVFRTDTTKASEKSEVGGTARTYACPSADTDSSDCFTRDALKVSNAFTKFDLFLSLLRLGRLRARER